MKMATPLEIALQKKLAEKAASSGVSIPSASVVSNVSSLKKNSDSGL
jgi:hypothetical protein